MGRELTLLRPTATQDDDKVPPPRPLPGRSNGCRIRRRRPDGPRGRKVPLPQLQLHGHLPHPARRPHPARCHLLPRLRRRPPLPRRLQLQQLRTGLQGRQREVPWPEAVRGVLPVPLLSEGRRQEELLWKLTVIFCWRKNKKIFGSKKQDNSRHIEYKIRLWLPSKDGLLLFFLPIDSVRWVTGLHYV